MKRDYWEIVQAMPAAELADLMRRFEDLGLYGVGRRNCKLPHSRRWPRPRGGG